MKAKKAINFYEYLPMNLPQVMGASAHLSLPFTC